MITITHPETKFPFHRTVLCGAVKVGIIKRPGGKAFAFYPEPGAPFAHKVAHTIKELRMAFEYELRVYGGVAA